ncbi:MAG: CpsB/CapC family capsule biosynthesis tyrosine phosphatase [Desulforegulaceae bacterium]|nr:CpsB/CapC family capsule biosynthesis tyrosine phosphatase [Desulforegulaceae bacterium]
MIDIHSHILPGIDDGSKSMRSSVEMALIAYEDGIDKMIATPHMRKDLTLEEIKEKVELFQSVLDSKEIDLKIYSGAEIPFELLMNDPEPVTLAGSEFILVEFPYDYLPDFIEQKFLELLQSGYKIIIAHPERNLVFMKNFKLLKNLLMPDVYLQVTAMSIKGSFGRAIKKFSMKLLNKNMISFFGSDCHDPYFRIPKMSYLLELSKKEKIKARIEKILNVNPVQIVS